MTRRRLGALRTMVSVPFRADRVGSLWMCVVVPASKLAPVVGAVAVKVLVDSTFDEKVAAAGPAGLLAGLTVLLTLATTQLSIYFIHAVGKRTDVFLEQQLADLLVTVPGIEHYERADYLDQVQLLRRQSAYIGDGLNAALQLAAQLLQVAAVCGLLARQEPLLLLLPVLALPTVVASTVSARLSQRAWESVAEHDRLRHRLVRLPGEAPVAREARLFGLAENLVGRWRTHATTVDRARAHAVAQTALLTTTGQLAFALAYVGAIVLVLHQALRGELTAGDVTMTIVLASQVQGFVARVVSGAQHIARVHQAAAKLEWLRAYADERRRPQAAGIDPPERLTSGLRLDRVTFRYPGTDTVILDNLSVELPAGTVIALVGENGAGKSSLVKLLLRLYEPTAGRILLDSINLADVDPYAWRQRATGAFQDFCRFEFTAQQSIGLGSPDRIDDRTAVSTAAQRADADRLVAELPHGLDTQLGAGWPGGVDLSGGQWQQVALARAQLPTVPLLCVLDEPTAALDAPSEQAVFERLTAMSHQVRDHDGVTLLVTHRFSTVRMADLILVLDHGRITESGSHDKLVRAGGLYAELYHLQARPYR